MTQVPDTEQLWLAGCKLAACSSAQTEGYQIPTSGLTVWEHHLPKQWFWEDVVTARNDVASETPSRVIVWGDDKEN